MDSHPIGRINFPTKSNTDDSYPFQLADADEMSKQPLESGIQMSQLLSSLHQLVEETKHLAVEDHNKVVGTQELATRMEELKAMLEEHKSMIIEQKENVLVQKSVEALRKTLITAKLVLKKALETTFRRGAKFKNPVRIVMNDIVLAQSKLGHSIALAYAKSGEPAKKLVGIKPGQEECLNGDKAFFGHGCAQDYGAALQAYKAAAELNYPPAINSLATMYREGKGTPKDLPLAIEWYKKGAALNNLDSINNLGQMHEAGEGVTKNLEVAIEFYQQAANGGHLDAQTNLGYIYEHGSEDDCFPMDHQILTEKGFLSHDQVVESVNRLKQLKIACYDRATDCIEYHPIKACDIKLTTKEKLIRFNQTMKSSNSLVRLDVTMNHRVYVGIGDGDDRHLSWSVQRAGQLLTEPSTRNAKEIRMRAGARAGLNSKAESNATFVQMGLCTLDQTTALLELYGFWLNRGVESSNLIAIETQTVDETSHLEDIIARLGLSEFTKSTIDGERSSFTISQDNYIQLFTPSQSASTLSTSLLTSLSRDELRTVLRGVHSSHNPADLVSGVIHTSSITRRDLVQQLCLHAGYSAYFERDHRTPNGWSIHYTNADDVVEPSFHIDRDVDIMTGASGASPLSSVPVWCVRVPHRDHLIVVRAVNEVDPTTGAIMSASRPLITGNCNYVPIDLDAAAAWYTEASEKNYAKAQNNLGYLYFIGAVGGTPDYGAAIKWFTRAADQGNAGAQNNLGICYESGKGVQRSEETAMQYYAAAARQGHPSALSSLGYLYLKQRKFELALDCLHKAAEQSDKEAFYHLAQMYQHGLHVEKSDSTAFMYHSKAAEQAHPFSILELGHSLFSGRGTKKDTEKAFAFYKQAANHNVSEAENSVGIMLEEGVGTIQDIDQAIYWYTRAASRGNADAIYNLALLYEQGKGVEKDPKLAMAKLKEAADLGSVQAKVRLEQDKIRGQ